MVIKKDLSSQIFLWIYHELIPLLRFRDEGKMIHFSLDIQKQNDNNDKENLEIKENRKKRKKDKILLKNC